MADIVTIHTIHVYLELNYVPTLNYCIAGNFRGSKLSQIRPKIIFMELIFANFIIQPFLYRIFHNFANFIFANLKKSRKERKLLASKVSGYTVNRILRGVSLLYLIKEEAMELIGYLVQ